MTLPIVDRLLAQAADALRRGAAQDALAFFRRVLSHDPRNEAACAMLADYHESRREHREAAVHVARLVGSRPEPQLFLRLAGLHHLAGDLAAAVSSLERVLQLTRGGRTPRERDLERSARWELEDVVRELERSGRVGPARSAAPGKHAGTAMEPPVPARPPTPSKARLPRPPERETAPAPTPARAPADEPAASPAAPLAVRTVVDDPEWRFLEGASARGPKALDALRLRIDFHRLTLLRDYDELVCLPSLVGVERFWYQVETVKKVLRDFRGRVLLADEVGLGKTIEAAMALKEYVLRGLVRTVLILTPPGLVSQWKEELASKFGLDFTTTDDADPAAEPAFWGGERIIASLALARSRTHASRVASREYDLVIVDEAHRLKNRETLAWKLVDSLKTKYVFFLTATPVENDLIELYNLITLLKPGALRTETEFRKEYTRRGDPREAKNPEALRGLLRSVMIRNTRSLVDVKLPKRFAVTLLVEPGPLEREVYDGVTSLVRARGEAQGKGRGSRLVLATLLREAGSSPHALRETLAGDPSPEARRLAALAERIEETEKARRLVRLLAEKPGEKVIVFTQFRRSLDELAALLTRRGTPFAAYHGGLSRAEKERAIQRFRDEVPVLLATESGGEGHNLQFASSIVNYDLPWNPMRIEQRIGRLHRIGQTRDVFVFNLAVEGTLEHRLLDVLDRKINLFELVVGEVDMILGHLDEERDFDDVVFDLWRAAGSPAEAEALFEELGEKLVKAKATYRAAQTLDDALFSEDFEA